MFGLSSTFFFLCVLRVFFVFSGRHLFGKSCQFGFPIVTYFMPSPFPFGVWGRMWNSIVSVPDHCLVIYFIFTISRNSSKGDREDK